MCIYDLHDYFVCYSLFLSIVIFTIFFLEAHTVCTSYSVGCTKGISNLHFEINLLILRKLLFTCNICRISETRMHI